MSGLVSPQRARRTVYGERVHVMKFGRSFGRKDLAADGTNGQQEQGSYDWKEVANTELYIVKQVRSIYPGIII